MRRASPGRQATRLLLAIALLGCAVWLPSPARAAEPETWLTISIDSMSPAVPQRDGTVRLAGTVRNSSDVRLTRLQAVLWRSLDPISDREGMDQALASPANEPLGGRVRPQSISENIPSDNDRTLDPGEATAFDLTAAVEDFELPDEDGIYLIGVQVRGRRDGGGGDEILGRGRIFMPLPAAGTEQPRAGVDGGSAQGSESVSSSRVPQQLTSIVLLSSRPSLVRTGVVVDDHLAEEVAPGGRLRVLLDAARQPGTTYAIDPSLVTELETMRRGYQILARDDSVRAGAGSVAAARWLDDFARLLPRGDGYKTLYGSPDLTALIHSSQQEIIAEAKAAGDEVAVTRTLPLLVLPGAGRADDDTMAAVSQLGAKAILVSESTARGDGPVLAKNGGTPLVSYSATALAGGPGPSPRRTPAKIRQRALAESWLAASTATENDPSRQVRLVSSAAQAASVTSAGIPWLQPRTLTSLLAETPEPWAGEYAYGSKARAAELDAAQLKTIAQLQEDYTTYVDLFVEPQRAEAQRRAVLPRAASSLWRGELRAFKRYTDVVGSEVDLAERAEISIIVTPRVQTTGRAAAFPITVRNQLPASEADPQFNAVRVVLRFTSVNSQRLTVEPIEIPNLAADSSQTEDAQVRAETNGSVDVSARLYTVTGRYLGVSEPIGVNATQAGTIGWIIAIVAGVVLVGTTALRIRQVAKERSVDVQSEPEPVTVSRPVAEVAETTSPAPAKDRDPLDV